MRVQLRGIPDPVVRRYGDEIVRLAQDRRSGEVFYVRMVEESSPDLLDPGDKIPEKSSTAVYTVELRVSQLIAAWHYSGGGSGEERWLVAEPASPDSRESLAIVGLSIEQQDRDRIPLVESLSGWREE